MSTPATTKLYNPQRDKLSKFESIEEYACYLKKIPEECYRPWTNYNHFNHIVDSMSRGTTTHLDAANKIINEMQDQNVFSVGLPTLQNSVAGFMPNVPAALIGHPRNMVSRAVSDLQGINTPLNIYMEPGISGGLTITQVVQRGISILAFVLAMQNIRPIELYIAETNNVDHYKPNCFGAAVKIDTKPLDLARACWVFTHPEYVCPIGFATSVDLYHKTTGKYSNYCGWSWEGRPQNVNYQQAIREIYDMSDTDIFIPGGHLFDSLMITDPVAWVKQMIAKHSTQMEG